MDWVGWMAWKNWIVDSSSSGKVKSVERGARREGTKKVFMILVPGA